MTSATDKTRRVRIYFASAVLSLAFVPLGRSVEYRSAQDPEASGRTYSSKRMADGKQWTIRNLDVNVAPSYCYDAAELNCRQYGRLYTWDSAQRACESLKGGWRLPTDDDWRQMAKHYGGVREDSADSGRASYKSLLIGGHAGFNALLGGGREADDGTYARLEAHGFYWTASESDPGSAWFYNFGQGGLSLNRQRGGRKPMGLSVRCIKE